MQQRTESWNIKNWSMAQIKEQVNKILDNKDCAIEEIHITPESLEVKYWDKTISNPSKRY